VASAGAATGATSGVDLAEVADFGFEAARRVAAFLAGVAGVAGVAGTADAGWVSETGAAFGFAVIFAPSGGFAGGLGAGLSRRVVMARASRAGLDPGLDQ
jgi:hypothetical protein